MSQKNTPFADISRASLDRSDSVEYANEPIRGINEAVVRHISAANAEPAWMLELRLKALEVFYKKPFPTW